MAAHGKLRTATYSQEARDRLAAAVKKAREANGYMYRTTFARDNNIQSIRSLELLEAGKPGVGESILFAIGRALPRWNEDTPRVILEGGDAPEPPDPTGPDYPDDLRDDWERDTWDRMRDRPEGQRWRVILAARSEAI
jgi:hypothetical protein